MADDIPPWLEVMRAITGLSEDENGSNPKIEAMAAYIGRKFPEQADYASQYTDDSIAWCGVATDFCLAACTPEGISGPFGPTDTDKWMWAQSFASDPGFVDLGSPVPGAITVMTREGGGHVTLFEEWDNGSIRCRGGNQSNEVNVSTYDPDTVIGYFWPKDFPMPAIPPADRRTLAEGDEGADVARVQHTLGVHPEDGDFGAITDSAVKGYQAACSMVVDGEVGPQTWAKLDELDSKVAGGTDGLSPNMINAIAEVAASSPIARYSWDERGVAPLGYTIGMALSFACALGRLNAEDDGAWEMAKANTGDDDKDALAWYAQAFKNAGMDNSEDGVDTLRHLYALMIGLGMMESSGRYSEGRDQSASNTSADEAEAGLFQTSWNIRSCHSTIPPLLTEYWNNPCGFREQFQEGVTLKESDLGNFGSGQGAQYQFLSKYAPTFHTFVTAIGLRNACKHWGPINKRAAELKEEADEMLIAVQTLIEGGVEPEPPEPEPGPEPGQPRVEITASGPVAVTTYGDVYVTVNGQPYQPAKRRQMGT
jgi:uncharacterized protein (TIGR02594 family)